LSIIDTLGAGFRFVSRRLWLAVLPLVLDLYLWLGPKLSMRPVIAQMVEFLREMSEANASEVVGSGDAQAMTEMLMDMLQETLGNINLFALLAWGRLGVPSVAGISVIGEDARWVVELSTYWQVLLAQLVLLGIGLLIACVYLGLIASAVRGDEQHPTMALHRVPTHWLRLVAVFIPLSAMLAFAISFGMILGPLSIFIGVGLLWILLFITFVPQAIVLADQRPLVALWSSVAIVRSFFWPTLGIILLVNVISSGLGLIWNQLLLGTMVGTAIALLANAFVGTGLTVSLFLFFRDRIMLLRERLEQQRRQGTS